MTAEITINTDPAAPFNSATTRANAHTILHELGHVYTSVPGLGTSAIVLDGRMPAVSLDNTAMVAGACP
jgi:hypothetical protein